MAWSVTLLTQWMSAAANLSGDLPTSFHYEILLNAWQLGFPAGQDRLTALLCLMFYLLLLSLSSALHGVTQTIPAVIAFWFQLTPVSRF